MIVADAWNNAPCCNKQVAAHWSDQRPTDNGGLGGGWKSMQGGVT